MKTAEILKDLKVRIINQLPEWNFLESRGMKGVRVTSNPPHLSRFAVLLPVKVDEFLDDSDSLVPAFKQVIDNHVSNNPDFSVEYYHVGSMAIPELNEWERFCNDVQLGLLASAIDIFVAPPVEFQQRLKDFPIHAAAAPMENREAG